MDSQKIAAALRALADAFEADTPTAPRPANTAEPAPAAATAAPAPRGRGRPPKAASEPAKEPAAPAAAEDPFAAAPAAPPATQDDVRSALTALAEVTDQATALKILKDVGESANLSGLSPTKYNAVVAAAVGAMPPPPAPPPDVQEEDPFETEPAKETAKPLTIEDVKAAAVAAQKRTSQDTVMKVIMDLGGKAPKDGGGYGPSLKALPASAYGAAITALENLPKTK